MSKRYTKLFTSAIKSVDEAKRTIKFCFSDNSEDRMGEVVDQASWQVDNYKANPVILFGHDPSTPENVLGSGVSLDLNVDGKSYVTARFDTEEVNPKADMVFRQCVAGTLRTVSAGFINHSWEVENDIPVLKDNELLEISIVPIPANPRAIALSVKDGSLSRKDASFLLDAMEKEASYLKEELAKNNKKEKTMDDATAQKLIDAVAGLTEKFDELQASTAELKEQITALKPVEAEETEEEKAAREAAEKEAADKAAAEEADAEAKRLAEEQAAKGKNDPAKDGDNDQSGAGEEEEFGDDTELTPEQEAEMEAAFQEQLAALNA